MMPLNKSRLIISRVVSKSSFCRAAAAASSSSSDAAAKAKLTYTERQAALGRPVSPHVTIYKFPVAAISSITNRVTGVGLFAGVSAVGAITLFGGDSPLIMKAIGQSAIGPLAKGIVAFPLVYHYLGGLRHVIWDQDPESHINNESVERTSYQLFGVSIASSLFLAFYTI